MKKLLLITLIISCARFLSQAQLSGNIEPLHQKTIAKLTFVDGTLAHSYKWWRRVNPANITFFPSLNISDLNNHDTSLNAYAARTVISFSHLGNNITDLANDSMVYLEPLVNLQKLLLTSVVDDKAIQHLANLKNLTYLECISNAGLLSGRYDFRPISDNSMTIIGKLTNLEVLRLPFCKFVTDAGLIQLSGLTKLLELDCTAWGITDSGLSSIATLDNLQVLNLSGTQITDNGITTLVRLHKLKELDLTKTPITDAGLINIMDMLRQMRGFKKLTILADPSISANARKKFVDTFPGITLVQ